MKPFPLHASLISFWYRLLQHNKKELGNALATLSDRYAQFVEEILAKSTHGDTIRTLAMHCSRVSISEKKSAQLVRDKGFSYCLCATIHRLYRIKHPPAPPPLLQIAEQELAIAQRFGDPQSESFYHCMVLLEKIAISDNRIDSGLAFCYSWRGYCEECGEEFPFTINRRIEYPKGKLCSIVEEIRQRTAASKNTLTSWLEAVLSKEFLCTTLEKQKEMLEQLS